MSLDRTCRLTSHARVWLVGAVLIGFALLILFSRSIPWADTPDGLFHFQRTRALTEAFEAHLFYPRLFPDFAFGYGHPILHYYAPLSYYPAAALHGSGLDLEFSVVAGLALFTAASALAMYGFLRCWTDVWPALAGALLYLLWPYRLYDLYTRGALPEFAAFTWLPLIGLGLFKLWQHAGRRSSMRESIEPKYLVLTVLAWCALVLTHNLSALIVLLALGLLLPFIIIESGRNKHKPADLRDSPSPSNSVPSGTAFDGKKAMRRVLVISIPLAIGAGLASFYALPALLELKWVSLGQFQNKSGYGKHFADLNNLFDWSFPYSYPEASAATVPVPGTVLVIMVLLALLCFDGGAKRLRPAAIACLILCAGSLLLITNASRPLWDAAAPLLSKLVFPWRWQVVLGFSTVWGTALLLQWVGDRFFRRAVAWYALLLGVLLSGLVFHAMARLPRSAEPLEEDALSRQSMWEFDAAAGQAGTTWLGEFMSIWVDEERWAIGRQPTAAETTNLPPMAYANDGVDGTASIMPVGDGYLRDRFLADLARPMRLIFHTFFLPAWQVQVDGQEAQTFAVSNLGLLAVDLSEGQHELTLEWATTSAVAAGQLASGIAWTILLVLLMALGHGRRKLVISWMLLGLFVAAVWVWPQRETVPVGVGADFGEVRLEAAHAEPAHAGKSAEVELTWMLARPEQALTAFVHLIGPDGKVEAQHDGPLAGVYTPYERWLPGMLVKRKHVVPIPADLAPGTYELMAGVYLSADPSSVLMPLSVGGKASEGATHRVRVGALEVRP